MADELLYVKDVARLTGVTVRTLHHYDRIGLLEPSGRSKAGYRLFSGDDLLRLQQILIYRRLGLPLEKIRRILDDPAYDRRTALLEQRRRLREQAGQTAAMLRAVDAALAAIEGEVEMDPRKLFEGFDPKEYQQEAEARWGQTDAYRESARRTERYSKEDWVAIRSEEAELMQELASKLQSGADPEDREVLELAERHRLHIDRWYYPCSRFRHAGLARLYVADERFTQAFDKHASGLAQFLARAIEANLSRG